MFNRRKINTLVGMLLLISSATMAQSYVEEALLFSQTKPGGSARIQAIGGAQIALGGDYSSALSNPAGLGMYNRSEITFSPALSVYTSKSNYLNNSDKDGKPIFNIPGASAVFHGSKDKNGFLGGSFGISMSRINDFQGLASFHGRNDDDASIIYSYIDQATGYTTAQFDENASQWNTTTGLAYNNYLIGSKGILIPPGPSTEYFTDVTKDPDQLMTLETKGRTNQWNISYGGNYKDVFFFGGGIGITSLKYNSQSVFNEAYSNDPKINEMSVTENLQIKGSGINATVGFIVRPVNFLQIGASIVTPTLYNISDSYDASMNSSWKNFDYYGSGNPEEYLNEEAASTDFVISEYSLKTPLKFSAGLAFISKFGFISGDVELTNPAQAKYITTATSTYNFSKENSSIKSIYKSTVNYRIGAEYRYKIYRVRGGFGVQGNSYQKDSDLNNSITSISGGVGIKTSTYFIDLALINSSRQKYYYQPYSFGDGSGPVAAIKKSTFTGMITVGFTF